MHMAKVEELVAQAKALQKAMKEGKAGAGVSCSYTCSYGRHMLVVTFALCARLLGEALTNHCPFQL